MTNLTALAVQAARASTTTEIPIWLVEISHPDFTTLRFAGYTEDVIATSQVSNSSQLYTGVGLEAKLPDDVGESQPDVTIAIHDASQTLVQAIRTVDMFSRRIRVTAWLIFASHPDTAQRGKFTWDVVSRNNGENDVVRLILKQENLTREQFPRLRFTPSRFPSMM